MTMDRQHGDIVFECDTCENVLETKQADFSSAWNMAQREGWKSRKVDGNWVHFCCEEHSHV